MTPIRPPYWRLKSGPAREAAKREYEAGLSADPTPHRVKGGLAVGSTFYPVTSKAESKLVFLIASAGHTPMPRDLLRVETIDGKPTYVGVVSGRHYNTFSITPRTAVIALDFAVSEEECEAAQRS